MYKEFMGEFEQLEFPWGSEEEIKESERQLGNVFTNNPNWWFDKICWLNHDYWGDKDTVVGSIICGDINIYKYLFPEPDEPKSEDEKRMYDVLADHGKSNNSNTQWLYWRAYKFFQVKELYLILSSAYMKLTNDSAKISILYGNILEDCALNNNNDKNKKEISILAEKSLVRCGAFDADKLINYSYQSEYMWIFPTLSIPHEKCEYKCRCQGDFTERRYKAIAGTKIPCYLIEITQKFKEKLEKNEMSSSIVNNIDYLDY